VTAVPYTTLQAVRDVIAGQGDSSDGTAASLDDTAIAEKIAIAQAQVDESLLGNYTVPFTDGDVPPSVQDITATIAAYLCDLSYRQNKAYTTSQTPILLMYQRAVDRLKALSNGTSLLPDKYSDGGTHGDDVTVVNQYTTPMFGPCTFGVNPNSGWWY